MRFNINFENGTGMEYYDKQDFLNEISAQIDDCIENGGTEYSIEVYADADCFANE